MNNSEKGAQVYTPLSLKLYDWWVLNISNNYAWRCKTESILLKHFQRSMGKRHLDIGVGTGYYIEKTPHTSHDITLLDLNPNSLQRAKNRIGSARVTECVLHDVFQPLPPKMHGSYDSTSLFYLLHCLPGNMLDKGLVINHAASAINENGVLYGATILGEGVSHNIFGQKLMSIYNKKGIFSNHHDSITDLRTILSAQFNQVEITLQGTVALFTAKQKKH